MILFLTVIYIGVLFLLVRAKLLKPTIWVKLSPIAWVLVLLLGLFIPLRFWAPMGDVRCIAAVIPIVPNVKGTVVEIPVQPNVPVRQGDVLFRIDPRPYQYQVDKLEAALASANLAVAQLNEKLAGAEAATAQAYANLLASESDFDRQAREALEHAQATVRQVEASLKLARDNFKRSEELIKDNVISQSEFDEARRRVESFQAQLEQASAAERKAREDLKAGGDRLTGAREALHQAESSEREARLAYEATIDGVNPQVREILADLDNARWQLEETVVRAPADGYVTNVALRPGAMAAATPLVPAMAFVTNEKGIGMFVGQSQIRLVKPGQEVEIALALYPGKVFKGKVHSIVEGTRQGQVQIGGSLMNERSEPRGPFAVLLEPGDELRGLWLPPGAGGVAAIYTGKGKPAYIIRRVMICMDSWLNYVR
jgi:multidrug resistance efflux pump